MNATKHTPTLPLPLHVEFTRTHSGTRHDICGPAGRILGSIHGEGEADAIVACVNAHDALTARVAELERALDGIQRHANASEFGNNQRKLCGEICALARAALERAK